MARIRTVKPEFQNSQSMGRVSRDARLTFIELWPQCDDAGRIRANSRMLASVLFPYDEDAPKLIDGWLGELEKEGCVVRYVVDRDEYLAICHWDHQKIDHPQPSKLPPPPEKKRAKTKLSPREQQEKPRELSEIVRAVSSTVSGPDRIGEDQVDLTTFGLALSAAIAAARARGEEFIRLPTNRFEASKEEISVFADEILEYEGLYPAIDVSQQLRNIRAWLLKNRAKRKTKKGMPRFVNSWLSREQDKGRGNGSGPPIHNGKSHQPPRNSFASTVSQRVNARAGRDGLFVGESEGSGVDAAQRITQIDRERAIEVGDDDLARAVR